MDCNQKLQNLFMLFIFFLSKKKIYVFINRVYVNKYYRRISLIRLIKNIFKHKKHLQVERKKINFFYENFTE